MSLTATTVSFPLTSEYLDIVHYLSEPNNPYKMHDDVQNVLVSYLFGWRFHIYIYIGSMDLLGSWHAKRLSSEIGHL